MDEFLFIGLLIFVFIGGPIGLGYLLYFIPKKLGYPKTGKYLTIAFGLLMLSFILRTVFEDKIFFKYNAEERLEEHNMKLKDDFEIISNQSGGFMDYFHQFALTISPQDKERIKIQIITADNYQNNVEEMFDLKIDKIRYSDRDTSFNANYQDQWNYIYEYYKPNKQGYKPIWNKISISKTENKLIYERILD